MGPSRPFRGSLMCLGACRIISQVDFFRTLSGGHIGVLSRAGSRWKRGVQVGCLRPEAPRPRSGTDQKNPNTCIYRPSGCAAGLPPPGLQGGIKLKALPETKKSPLLSRTAAPPPLPSFLHTSPKESGSVREALFSACALSPALKPE